MAMAALKVSVYSPTSLNITPVAPSSSYVAASGVSGCSRLSWVLEESSSKQRARGWSRKVVLAAQKDRPGVGDSESKQVLDAFFLGKAFADTINERLGSAIGEFLSEIGRKQAEQQKEVRKFQEEVQERARMAKLKAARQALSTNDAETTKEPLTETVSPAESAQSDEFVPPKSSPASE